MKGNSNDAGDAVIQVSRGAEAAACTALFSDCGAAELELEVEIVSPVQNKLVLFKVLHKFDHAIVVLPACKSSHMSYVTHWHVWYIHVSLP